MDSAQSGEAFRKATQTIQRVNIRGLAISFQGVCVQLNSFDGLQGRLVEIVVISMKSHSVASEGLGVGIQAVFRVHFAGSHAVQSLPCRNNNSLSCYPLKDEIPTDP